MSKRIVKNIIMIALIIVLCFLMYFTVNIPRNRFVGKDKPMQEMHKNGEIPEGNDFLPKNINALEKPIAEIPEKQNEMGVLENGETPKEDWQRGERLEEMPNHMRGFQPNIILIVFEALGISILLIYLILSKLNELTLKETLENKTKIGNFIILVILVTAIITMLIVLISKNNRGDFDDKNGMMPGMEEEVEKTTKAEDVESGENINTETINLNEHTSNITITEAGTYTLTGKFSYTVLVDADGEVVLNFNNLEIKNELTAALANISGNPLIINLLDETNNILSDGGSSEYDACLFSSGPLTITGTGKLDVYGNQDKGEGIATETNNLTINSGTISIVSNDDGINAGGDGGTIEINGGKVTVKASGDGIDSNKDIVINGGEIYAMGSSQGGDAGLDADNGVTINGGNVIALGSDMLEKPNNNSKQKYIAVNLNEKVKDGSEILLKDENGNLITSFTANTDFKTLIISNEKLEKGKYYLYQAEKRIMEVECK